MRKTLIAAALAVALAQAQGVGTAQAQDVERGRLLYETHCGECHYQRVHERSRPGVKDLAELRDVVWLRARQTKRRSFALDELEDITQYLNASRYRFGAAKER